MTQNKTIIPQNVYSKLKDQPKQNQSSLTLYSKRYQLIKVLIILNNI